MARRDAFQTVFEAEAQAVNRRRKLVADGVLDRFRTNPPPQRIGRATVEVLPPKRPEYPNEIGARAAPRSGHELFGIALSGGGIRSAALCLGALQGVDAACGEREPQILDEADYLSTVSGGGYMGVALVNALTESKGLFPFASKLDQEETIETKHLRYNANYLMPRGPRDLVIGALAVVRGLLVNVFVFLSLILLAAALTVALNPDGTALALPMFPSLLPPALKTTVFAWTILAGFAIAIVVIVAVVFAPWTSFRSSLAQRERASCLHFWLSIAWLGVFLFEAQAYVLGGLFDAGAPAADGGDRNRIAAVIDEAAALLKAGWPAILTALATLMASVTKLTSVVKATTGDRSWSGSLARWGSKGVIYLAAALAPILIWVAYVTFSYWGVEKSYCYLLKGRDCIHHHAPAWLSGLASCSGMSYPTLYGVCGALLLAVALFVRPNAGSLHSYYRDRLSRAFLWDRKTLAAATKADKRLPPPDRADIRLFSGLKRQSGPLSAFAPYLLVNTAVNLGGSRDLNRRARNADNFVFSPLFMGAEATGYLDSPTMEKLDPNANMATAMASSGAAASANMGASTIRPLTFTLSAFNIRLGYWIANPARRLAGTVGPRPGIWYFFREAFGLIDERDRYVYLTDGGHYDNLGLYELFKRRCRVIMAVDAEADPLLHFDSLIRLQRYARIDLGARIELPWPKLKEQALQITAACPTGSPAAAFLRNGPHVVIGRVQYSEDADDIGILIYCKASLSGDESDLLRDYKRRNSDFPHETTVDQFFSEEQFEVYRSLGFHMLKHFLSGEDRVPTINPKNDPHWGSKIEAALERIAVPPAGVAKIMANLVT
jgi:hypothetical protein